MLANSGIKLTKTWLSLPFYILLSYLNSEHPSVQLIVSFIISNSNFRFMLKILLPFFSKEKWMKFFLTKYTFKLWNKKHFDDSFSRKAKKMAKTDFIDLHFMWFVVISWMRITFKIRKNYEFADSFPFHHFWYWIFGTANHSIYETNGHLEVYTNWI